MRRTEDGRDTDRRKEADLLWAELVQAGGPVGGDEGEGDDVARLAGELQTEPELLLQLLRVEAVEAQVGRLQEQLVQEVYALEVEDGRVETLTIQPHIEMRLGMGWVGLGDVGELPMGGEVEWGAGDGGVGLEAAPVEAEAAEVQSRPVVREEVQTQVAQTRRERAQDRRLVLASSTMPLEGEQGRWKRGPRVGRVSGRGSG